MIIKIGDQIRSPGASISIDTKMRYGGATGAVTLGNGSGFHLAISGVSREDLERLRDSLNEYLDDNDPYRGLNGEQENEIKELLISSRGRKRVWAIKNLREFLRQNGEEDKGLVYAKECVDKMISELQPQFVYPDSGL